jgi:arylsulfatase A-like enzyme
MKDKNNTIKVIGRRDLLKMGGAAATSLVLSSCRSILPQNLSSLEANRDGYNVLFIFADQMHGFAMGCMGNPDVKTPNLDRLAAEGTLFRNTYSCYPVCTPYRGILMTGRYAHQTGVVENEKSVPANERTLAAALNDGGYRTSYIGKWHLGGKDNTAVPPELRAGFTDFIGYQCYNDFLDQVWFFDEKGEKKDCKKHRTDATTDIAIERLEKIKDRKFAMFVSYQNPHYPEQPSKEYEDMYAGMKIHRRPNCRDIDPYTRTFSPPRTAENDPMYKKYNKSLDTYLKLYYAMITQLDYNIGRIMSKLQEFGIADKTVVMFTSDHGDMQGSHGLKNKNIFYEESVRVPMIVKVPGSPKGIVSDELVGSVDLFPSILDYGSLPKEKSAEGISFVPLMTGKKPRLRSGADAVFSEGGDVPKSEGGPGKKRWFMIREGKYKLAVMQDDFTPTHLFDLENDPYEMKNLIEDKNSKAICENLQKRIKYWHKDIMKRANPATLVKGNNEKTRL